LPAQNPQNAQNFSRFEEMPAAQRPRVAFGGARMSSEEQSQDVGKSRPPLPPGASPRSGMPPPAEHRWKKGQSGNPGGRPKGRSITAALREILEREHNGKPIADLIAERLVKDALSGKFPHLKEVLERADGKTTDKQEVTVQRGWRAAVDELAELPDHELIELAAEKGLSHLLPPRLAEIARRDGLYRDQQSPATRPTQEPSP
jgi:hypothetical protein